MSATVTEQEHRCSCGRTFAHEISLKRHRWVTGHAEADGSAASATPAEVPALAFTAAVTVAPTAPVAPVLDAEETYRQAVAVMMQKRQELETEAERQRQAERRQALVQSFVLWLQSGLLGLLQTVAVGGRATATACGTVATWTVKLVVVALVALGLLFSGMGVGRLIASQAQAQPVTAVSAGYVLASNAR